MNRLQVQDKTKSRPAELKVCHRSQQWTERRIITDGHLHIKTSDRVHCRSTCPATDPGKEERGVLHHCSSFQKPCSSFPKGLIVEKVFSEQSLPFSSAETQDLTVFRSNTKKGIHQWGLQQSARQPISVYPADSRDLRPLKPSHLQHFLNRWICLIRKGHYNHTWCQGIDLKGSSR